MLVDLIKQGITSFKEIFNENRQFNKWMKSKRNEGER